MLQEPTKFLIRPRWNSSHHSWWRHHRSARYWRSRHHSWRHHTRWSAESWLHHRCRRSSHSAYWTLKTWLNTNWRNNRHSSTSRFRHSGTRQAASFWNFRSIVVTWRRSFDGHADNVLASQQNETQNAFFFSIRHRLAQFRLDASEFLAVGYDYVHVFIESFEIANESAAVLQRNSHSIINMLKHFVILANCHFSNQSAALKNE